MIESWIYDILFIFIDDSSGYSKYVAVKVLLFGNHLYTDIIHIIHKMFIVIIFRKHSL